MFSLASALQFISSDPIPNFYFMVGIGSMPLAVVTGLLSPGYTEVNGLSISIDEVKDIGEIGVATSIPFPKGLKNDALTLKRYVRVSFLDALGIWCRMTFGSVKTWATGIKLQDVYVTINHPSSKAPICVFHITDAYPVKWEVDQLSSTGNEALQETIELRYRSIDRIL
jgi:T4-like virus tail tube protein gp19